VVTDYHDGGQHRLWRKKDVLARLISESHPRLGSKGPGRGSHPYPVSFYLCILGSR